MKKNRTFTSLIGALLFFSITFLSCQNSPNNTSEGSGQTDNIAPSDADETRYNLSEQQKMTMQKDTTLLDSIQHDTVKK